MLPGSVGPAVAGPGSSDTTVRCGAPLTFKAGGFVVAELTRFRGLLRCVWSRRNLLPPSRSPEFCPSRSLFECGTYFYELLLRTQSLRWLPMKIFSSGAGLNGEFKAFTCSYFSVSVRFGFTFDEPRSLNSTVATMGGFCRNFPRVGFSFSTLLFEWN